MMSRGRSACSAVLLGLLLLVLVAADKSISPRKNIVCYFGAWSNYRPGDGKFTVDDINPFLCTHLVYAFFGINTNGTVSVLDPWLDLTAHNGLGTIQKFNALKRKNPTLKTLAAIGGWYEDRSKFSEVAANGTLRINFARDATLLALKYRFDGIDIDWEYPTWEEKALFVVFLRELRMELNKFNLLLTVAVAASIGAAKIAYDIAGIAEQVHFINIMEYDFHGTWETSTGHHAPLYAATPSDRSGLSVNASVHHWLSHGAPAGKINLGVPLYGRSFTLSYLRRTGVGVRTKGPGDAGPYTREPGMLGYNEICEQQWTRVMDMKQKAIYAYSGNQWVSYDDVESMWMKCSYVKEHGLAGGMVWTIDTDDFRGNCGEPYPLLRAFKMCLDGTASRPKSVASTTTTPARLHRNNSTVLTPRVTASNAKTV